MTSIPDLLNARLRAILMRSNIFDSAKTLHAIFTVSSISTWANIISDATLTHAARVDALIDDLHDQANARDENALILFLHVLLDQEHIPPATADHRDLAALLQELEPVLSPAAPFHGAHSLTPALARTSSPSPLPMIDREEAVAIFRQMLAPTSANRTLRLVGSEKMGKSHLLRAYRDTAQRDYRAICALVDVRTTTLSYSDILHQCCQQLGVPMPTYDAALADITRRHDQNTGTLNQLFARLTSARQDEQETGQHDRHRLTSAFVQDLRSLSATYPILILFDSVEQALADTRTWIACDLLTALFPLERIRTVIAGRSLPDTPTTWQDTCCSYELQSVQPQHYRRYCETLGLSLDERELELIYQMGDGKPGFLVDMMPKLLSWGGSR